MHPILTLKPGKDKPIRHRHHWIFSGAIKHLDPCEDGDIVLVQDAHGERLGYAYVNHHTSITARMINFGSDDPIVALQKNIGQAIAMREQLFNNQDTNAYRLINSEGDGIPGLIADKYADSLVVQSTTAGMDLLMPTVVETLEKHLSPACIYERSDAPSRREEKIEMKEGLLAGTMRDEVEIRENGMKFFVSISKGQKTGFFLDQREMRQWVREHAKNKRVLNCFGYTGGFTAAALVGGATQADTIDISEDAIVMAEKNIELNGFNPEKNNFIVGDVFEYLRNEPLPYDLVVLDPPAFAKKKTDIVSACRGYKDINRLAIQKMPAGSTLVTSSCSYHVDERLFQMVVFEAAHDAKRNVRIIGRHRQAPDHPINIFHPEGEYLKSLVLFVE
ncbi:MAG: class I SAM-dependent rRNA methyltransferase [Patescibacteria group bacterium]